MAIASVGTVGTLATSGNGNTLAGSPSAQIDAGNLCLIAISVDNVGTTDADFSEVTGISDNASALNIYKKIGEFTNGQGSAGAGVTCSLWYVRPLVNITTGSTITIAFSAANAGDRCASMWEFTVGGAVGIAGTNQNATDGSNGFGSLAISSLGSQSYLFFRALAKEANSTTDITVTAGHTAISVARSRNNAAAVLIRGEFIIATATSDTSNPTLAVSGDTSSVMVAMMESLTQSPAESMNNLADAHLKTEGQLVPVSDSANAWSDYFVYGKRPRWRDTQAQSLASAALTVTISDDLNNWGDAYVQIEGQRLTFAESINNLDDAYTQIGNGLAAYSDNLNLWVEYFTYGKRPRWQDSVSAQLPNLALSFSDSLNNWADDYAHVEGQLKVFSEDLNNLADAHVKTEGQLVPCSDSLPSQADGYSMIEGQLKSFSDDANNLADSLDKIEELRPTFSDSFTLTDSCGLGYGLGCVDGSNTLADSLASRLSQALTLTDSLNAFADNVELFEAGFLSFSDSFTLTDSLTKEIAQLKILADSFTLTDAISLREEHLLAFADSFTFADSLAARFDYRLGLSDSFTLLDSMAFSGGGFGDLEFVDSLIFSDAFLFTLGLTASGTDDLNNWADDMDLVEPFPALTVRVKRDSRTVVVKP